MISHGVMFGVEWNCLLLIVGLCWVVELNMGNTDRRKLHLIAPAGSVRPFFDALNIETADRLIEMVQQAVGDGLQVTGDRELIEAGENERQGGRVDDERRADDLQAALGDDAVAAIVLIRGGAWFTRILPRIDFSALDRRHARVAVFGFSELTTLVNIVGSYEKGIGIYDMGPAFLTYGLKRQAMLQCPPGRDSAQPSASWMGDRLVKEFETFFKDVVSMIGGQGSSRSISARLVRGTLPPQACRARFTGGNLTVMSTMIGSTFDACLKPVGRWLFFEDFNDKLERIDRFLSHLTLSRYWDVCEGILVGDFHRGYEDQTPSVLELLPYHLPKTFDKPILVSGDVGHVCPMSPLPLHVDLTITPQENSRYAIDWPREMVKTL